MYAILGGLTFSLKRDTIPGCYKRKLHMHRTFHRDRFTWLAYLSLAFYGYFLNVLGPIGHGVSKRGRGETFHSSKS